MPERRYLCIDLKSFYASVECVERGLNPMTANLVVADPERSDKTICLAVSPSMKRLGVKNRCRVFEIPKNIEYITAPPRMQKYIDYAAEIYGVYLNYISEEDIYVYSIDEVFIDVTDYLKCYRTDAKGMAVMLMNEISEKIGVRAACGIGTNLYLTKIALDITAKHSPDFIGILDEQSYRETLWEHRPLTDFWRIGAGTAKRLAKYGIYTMGQIAHTDEDFLYRLFGIDAELLIDHAWGREPTTIADIKAYRAKTNSLTSGQVLMRDYKFNEGRLIVKEMADALCLELVRKNLVAKSVSLRVGYSNSLHVESDGASEALSQETNSDLIIIPAITSIYDRVVNRTYPIKRVNITFNDVKKQGDVQLSFFYNESVLDKNNTLQKTVIDIKDKFGKNAILKGMNFEEGATAMERNRQIGGHKSG